MRLQRMGTYRLIRILRFVLPVAVLVLIGIPARNYWKSRDQTAAAERKPVPIASDVSVQTFNYSVSHFDGKSVVHVTAKEQFLFKDYTYKFRGVRVVISSNKPGEFDQIIVSDECVYYDKTGYVHFTGNVNAQLDATTSAQTQELIYTPEDRSITSPVKTHIEQPGEMTGDVNQLKYWIDPELLVLTGNLAMQMSNGEALHTDVGEFQKKENWAVVKGGVFLQATNGWLRGSSGRADLQPGTYRPLNVTIDGDVTSESHGANSPDILKTHSSSMTSVLTPDGIIRHVFARGDVRAEHQSRDAVKTITGAEVEAALNEHGRVETLEARQAAAPYARMVESDRSLVSSIIRIKSDGNSLESSTVTTAESSTLTAGGSTIIGRAFEIVQTDKLAFDTRSPATIQSTNKDGVQRTTSGDLTHIDINSKTNALEKLTQTGNFSFKEGESRSGSADKGVITDAGSRVELIGHFVFKEGARSGSAGRALFTDNGDTVEMWDAVSFKDASRRGSAAHAKFYNGGSNVELNSPTGAPAKIVDDEKKSEVQGRRITLNQKTNEFEAWADVFTESRAQPESITVYASHAKSVDDLFQYDGGNVRLYRGTTSEIHADSIVPDGKNGFTATGRVTSKIEGMKADADKLVYNGELNTAVYYGNVHAIRDDRKGIMDLRSADMTLAIDPGDSRTQKKAQLKDLKANGKVVVVQGARRGTGDHLIYNYATDDVTLTADKGSEVTFDDPPNKFMKSISYANWKSATGKAHFKNEQGGLVQSEIPVKAK